jgi:hypothetical protein
MAPRIELFAFRYRDPVSRKWVRARYVATREEIGQRYAEWEILRPAEVRDVDPDARYFTPHRQRPSNLGRVFTLACSSRRVTIAGVAI